MPKSTDCFSRWRTAAVLALASMLAGFASAGLAAGDDVAAEDRRLADQATSGPAFEIAWETVNGGATFATGGNYQLRGTVGQPDADPDHPAQSTDFEHTGGFWTLFSGAGVSVRLLIFRDRFEQ